MHTFGGNDFQQDSVRPSDQHQDMQMNMDDSQAKKIPQLQRSASRQSNISFKDQKLNSQRNSLGPQGQKLSRSTIANQMKYKNQQQFIPQPNLDMSSLSPNHKLMKRDLSKSKSSEVLELKGIQAPEPKDEHIEKHHNQDNYENSSSGDEDDSDSDYEEFQRNQRNKEAQDELLHHESQGQANDEQSGTLRAQKNIVAQVANLDTRSKFYKQTVLEIMNRIVSTMTSWELFSDNQIQDANTALKMLQQTLIYSPEDQKPIIRALVRLVGSNEVPLHIRFQIAVNVYLMFKNKVFMKLFVQDGIEAHMTLVPLYNILQETCVPDEKDDLRNDNMEELYFECVNILTLIMSLNSNRYHIPGETVERNKMRHNAIDTGVLIVVIYLMKHTKNEHLRNYIQEEFFEKVDETDFEYHFKNNHSHYAMVSTIIIDAKQRQELDEIMKERMGTLKQGRLIQERINQENRRKEQEKEELLQRELELALQEKRRLAEQKMDQRIKELNKIKAQNQKEELRQKQQLEQINQERKLLQQEEFKKKQEFRKKQQKQLLELKQQQEREMQEEIIKRNKDREIAKKIALDKWHQQKRDEEKRRKNAERVRVKSEKSKFYPTEYYIQDDKFKEYESKQQRKKAMQILKEYSGDFFNVDMLQSRGGIKKNRGLSYTKQVQDFISLQQIANKNRPSPREVKNSIDHQEQLKMPKINVNNKIYDQLEINNFNPQLSVRPNISANPSVEYDSRLTSADKQNKQQQIVPGMEESTNQSQSLAPALQTRIVSEEVQDHQQFLNKPQIQKLNEAQDQQRLVSQSTSLPHINYHGLQPLKSNNQPNMQSQNNVVPASITIINNDYSQTHFNNYYMARQQSTIKKGRNSPSFEDKLALKAINNIEQSNIQLGPPQSNYNSNPPDIDHFLKMNPAHRNSMSNRSGSYANNNHPNIQSNQHTQMNLITDMEDVLERRATKIKQLPTRLQSSSNKIDPSSFVWQSTSLQKSRAQSRKFNSFQQSPQINQNVIRIKSDTNKPKKTPQAIVKEGFQIYHQNSLAKESAKRAANKSPMDTLLELQESQLKTIFDKQKSNLFHSESLNKPQSKSSPQPGKSSKRQNGMPQLTTVASQQSNKVHYVFKDLSSNNIGPGSLEVKEAPIYSKSYIQDLISFHQQAIPSLEEIQSANESSSNRFKKRLNDHLKNDLLPQPRNRRQSKHKPQLNSQVHATMGISSAQRIQERSPISQVRANNILSGQGIASSAFKGFSQKITDGEPNNIDAKE